MFIKKATLILFIATSFLFSPLVVKAAQIENLTGTPIAGDYVIGPGKNELWMDPGKTEVRNLMITNRYGKDMQFKIELEDFKGSKVPGENIVLLGAEKGPYSLKEFLHPEMMNFILKHGQRITVPVTVQVPADAQPGGLYASVIVTAQPILDLNSPTDKVVSGNLTVISRLASLFFVRINGATNENGQLQQFAQDKHVYGSPEVKFNILYENTGNVYLDPYGVIEIKNVLGDKIDEVKIDPFFVMPDAIRTKDLSFHRAFMFGFYKANIKLNRGYGNMLDEKNLTFWVLPWKLVLLSFGVVVLLVVLLYAIKQWFDSNFERKPKT